MNTFSAKMKEIANTKYSEEGDPVFFIFLERLEKAALFKETDRINGRTALDDFISGAGSLRF
jgi:hypothetical protein